MLSPLRFWFFKWRYLPAAGFMGVRLVQMSDSECITSLRLSWRNTNPFRSQYFAAQSSAAELATGIIAFQMINELGDRISMLITHLEAQFHHKATGLIYYKCTEVDSIRKAIRSANEIGSSGIQRPVQVFAIEAHTGKLISTFTFHWSFKRRPDSVTERSTSP